MCWSDIASIVFVCVTANHLGLVKAIEDVSGRKLRIVSCPKCATFWSVLAYTTIHGHDMITSLAISFLASYTALWAELIEGLTDTLYNKIYETIYPDTDNDTAATDTVEGDSAGEVPEL